MIDYIEEHLEEELSLDRIVAEFFVSKYHIAHFLRIILEWQFISMCRKRDWRHAERLSGITRKSAKLICCLASKIIPDSIREKNHKLAEQIAEESIVLLKNDGFFPLVDINELLVIGELADKPRIQGCGSSHIHTTRITSFIEQFEEYGIKVRYARGY